MKFKMVENLEPLSEGSLTEKGWTVKRFSFDAVIPGNDASKFGLDSSYKGHFFHNLRKFIRETYHMEMAGDHIDVEDVTEQYAGKEFFFS